jgi:hypothetical protein
MREVEIFSVANRALDNPVPRWLTVRSQEQAHRLSLLSFCEWLENTPGSIALHESTWGYPLVESVHVLALCLFLGLAVMLDLRLLGLTMRRVAVSEVAGRLLPWTAAGFAVMIVSGALLFYGIPVRTYRNIFFRVKVILLVLSGLNAWVFHSTVYRKVAQWDLQPVPPLRARVAGALSLVFWGGVVVAGRMIAYNWFDQNP